MQYNDYNFGNMCVSSWKILILLILSIYIMMPVYTDDFIEFSSCIYDISVKHLSSDNTLIISHFETNNLEGSDVGFASHSQLILNRILKTLQQISKWRLLIFSIKNKIDTQMRVMADAYIVFIQSVHSMDIQLNHIKTSVGLNPHSKFLLVAMSVYTDRNRRSFAEEILTSLRKRNIFNAVVVVPIIGFSETNFHSILKNNERPAGFEFYTYFPYQPPGRCGYSVEAILIDKWLKGCKFINESMFFAGKIPTDFNGCTFRVSTFEYRPMTMHPINQSDMPYQYADGLEIRFVETMLKAMNISPLYNPPPGDERWGTNINGTWNGIFGEVQRGVSDMSFAVNVLDTNRTILADAVYPYLGVNLIWHVPCPKPMPHWSSLTRIFEISLWLAFILVYVLFSLVFWLLVYVQKGRMSGFSNLQISFLCLWALVLNMSPSEDIPNSKLIRCTFLLWAVYSFVINNLYQAFLTSYFVDPGLEPALTTEKELLHTNLKLGFHPHMALRHTELESAPYRRQIQIDDVDGGLKQLALKGDMAYLISPNVADYKSYFMFMTPEGKPGFCHLKEVFTKVLMTIYLQKGSPLLHSLNKYVFIVWQTGLVDKWYRDIISTAIATGHRSPTGSDSDDASGFSLTNLQSAFYALILGYLASILALIMEFLYTTLFSLVMKNAKKKI